jgi:hypothetical protein
MGNFWATTNRTVKQVINEKIQVLRDFYIVDDDNELDIRKMLTEAINNAPDRDPDVVVDRIARNMITERLSD